MCDKCDIDGVLREKGLARTGAREAVFSVLAEAGRPLTVKEVLSGVRRTGSIDKVTAYRTLHTFEEVGAVRRVSVGDGVIRYGLALLPFHPPHAHFVCSKCRVVSCLEGASTRRLVGAARKLTDQRPEDVSVVLVGTCSRCAK